MWFILTLSNDGDASLKVRTSPHSLQEMETTKLILLNKDKICESTNQVMLLIKSSIENYSERQSVRQTWKMYAKSSYNVESLFILGSSAQMMAKLFNEDSSHEDLLIGHFHDDYFNLTLKSTFAISWARTYCRNKWVFYLDDDSIVNVDSLMQIIRENGGDHANQTEIICHKLKHHPVLRAGKWAVSMKVYPDQFYPDYCLGPGYLLSPNTVPLLYDSIMSKNTQPKLWIDDVFITGIVAEKAGIPRRETPTMTCCGLNNYHIKNFNQYVQIQEVKPPSKVVETWNEIISNGHLRHFNKTGQHQTPNQQAIRNSSKEYVTRRYFLIILVVTIMTFVSLLLLRKKFRRLFITLKSIHPKSLSVKTGQKTKYELLNEVQTAP
jgi:beta-1,3-galactosyltransferase 1